VVYVEQSNGKRQECLHTFHLGGLHSQEAFTLTEEPITQTTLCIFGKMHFSEDTSFCAPIKETISLQVTEKVWTQYIGRQTADCEITSRWLHFTKARMENDSDRIGLFATLLRDA